MRTQKADFANKVFKESYYDLREDWHLIEASLATQYGIRIRNEKSMPFAEFATLVSGLMPETPLGGIVAIRAEKDKKTIKGFTAEQRQVHTDWKKKSAEKQLEYPEHLDRQMEEIGRMLDTMFGEKGGK